MKSKCNEIAYQVICKIHMGYMLMHVHELLILGVSPLRQWHFAPISNGTYTNPVFPLPYLLAELQCIKNNRKRYR